MAAPVPLQLFIAELCHSGQHGGKLGEAASEAGRAAAQVQEEARSLSQTSVELSDQANDFIRHIRAG